MRDPKIYNEPEITEPVDLCLPDGRLNPDAVGWSRYPVHHCNLSGSPLRKKRWNYWAFATDQFLFSVTLSDVDYLGLAFAYFLDFTTKEFRELTVTRLFGRDIELGNYVNDNAYFDDSRLKISLKNEESVTAILVESPDFKGEKLSVNLSVSIPPGHQTLNATIPWSNRRFQFTSKQNTLPVEGIIKIGEKEYRADGGYACLDFGRGIWPYTSFWNWASASGRSGEHLIGLNFGAGWTDGTGMNENGICIDGVLSKISEDLEFIYNPDDYFKPWKIQTPLSDRVTVTFAPFYERIAKTNALILKSEIHQLIGHFSGELKDAAGETYKFNNLIGWTEDHYANW
ncbi:MAG: DUF2804 domain-containing protein [Bacillota bacterium]